MTSRKWQDIIVPSGNLDSCWELYHENSKLSRFDKFEDIAVIRKKMKGLHESLPYKGYLKIDLPTKIPNLDVALGDAICSRRSVRQFKPATLDLQTVATLLYYSYGLTGRSQDVSRSFRAVPSGGALYPLELYFYSARIEGLAPGFYHYNPCDHQLRFLNPLDNPSLICQAVRQPELVVQASMIIFIVALFERSVFKYGDRGYRFVLMEVGHLAQNLHLVLQALSLVGISIGGFFDREIDKLLRFDGLTQSTLCMIALGENADCSN